MKSFKKLLWITLLILWCVNIHATKEIDENITIFIQNKKNKIITLKVNMVDTILSVKEKLELTEKVSVEKQKLQTDHQYTVLENDKHLYEYNIVHENTLFLYVTEVEIAKEQLTISQSLSTYVDLIEISESFKVAIVIDNVKKVMELLKTNKEQYFLNTIVPRCLYLAILQNSQEVIDYLVKTYKWATISEVKNYEKCHPKYEYAKNPGMTLGNHPLMLAILLRRLNVVEKIAKTGVKMDNIRHNPHTFFVPETGKKFTRPNVVMMAAAMDEIEIMVCLLNHGAGLHGQNGSTVLESAIRFGSTNCFEYLIQNFNQRQLNYGIYTILRAAERDAGMLKLLIQTQGNGPLCCPRRGKYIFHKMGLKIKKWSKFIEAMHVLLSNGGEKHINTECDSMTPLMALAYYDDIDEDIAIEIAKLFLENGANVQKKQNSETVLDIARKKNKNRLLHFIEENEKTPKCIICMQRLKTHIFIPCGHFCACEICALECKGKCFYCSENAQSIKVYHPDIL
jgi:ankyrin repeat protein